MNYFLTLAVILFMYMSGCFILSLFKKRNDIADVAWGIGFVLITWSSFFLAQHFNTLHIFTGILISIWGFRLAWHIYTRNKGKTEDYRYLAWRKEWGKWFYIRSYFQVYILQGVLLYTIILPVLFINNTSTTPWNILEIFGGLLWVFGFLFEAIGDAQLTRFIKNPSNKGKLMQSGLWQYTRHPNYFGEVVQWWGIWFIALSVPYGALTIIGPLTITFLILKISGIPLLEKKMNSHPEFAAYKQRVSMFIPLPPRKHS